MHAGGISVQHILICQCSCFTASGAVCPARVHPQGHPAASRAVSGELPSFVTAVVVLTILRTVPCQCIESQLAVWCTLFPQMEP